MAASGHNYLRTVNLKLEISRLNSLGYLGYNGMIFRRDNEFNGEDWFFSTKWGSVPFEDIQKLITNQNSSIWLIRGGTRWDGIVHLTDKQYVPGEYFDVKYGFDRISVEFTNNFGKKITYLAKKYLNRYKYNIKSNVLNIESNGYLHKLSGNEVTHVLTDKSMEIIKPQESRDIWRFRSEKLLRCELGEPKELGEFLQMIFISSFCKEYYFLKNDKPVIGGKREEYYDYCSEYYAKWEEELEGEDDYRYEDYEVFRYYKKNYFHWDFCINESYLKWLDKYKNTVANKG